MSVVTRFAPSPTGRLHIGNIRTALLNWLFARQQGGRFLLRLDDTDRARSREEHAAAIRADLHWLGMENDGEVRQSERMALYDAALERLRESGRVYPCYESAEELEVKRRVQLARGRPPVYDRAALKLSDADRAKLEAAGQRPHWRFLLETEAHVAWDDLIRGPTHIDPASISDPVVRREDGSYLYMLPSVVDDAALGISHVVRGEDHVPNSAVQVQMFAALGAEPPRFAHAALLAGTEGALSKRLGSAGIDALKAEGIEPIAVTALLARLGTSEPVQPFTSPEPLIAGFAFEHMGRATARFDPAELKQLNARIVHQLSYADVAERLPPRMTAAAWEAVRPNLETVAEAADWWGVIDGSLTHAMPAEALYLRTASEALPPEPWDADSWTAWTGSLRSATGRKGRALFQPLRLALTGREHGPGMAALLPLIGRERVLARLQAAAG